MNLAEALAATAGRISEQSAMVFRGEEITYGRLDHGATRVASALTGLGVDAGDRVALWLPNHPAFATAMYGVWRMGGVVVPLHAMLTEPEARHVLRDAGAKVLVCAGPQAVQAGLRLREELADLDHLVVLESEAPEGAVSFDELMGTGTDRFPSAELAPDHLALIAYTSGTSGLPKGAMLTHRNLQANLEQMRATPLAIGLADVTLCVLPLFHIFGLNVVLNLSVEVGAKIVLLERFDPVDSLQAVRDQGITVIAAAPPAYMAWMSLPEAGPDDVASVRLAVSGAAPLPREALDGFQDRFGVTIWEGYGLTETAPALTSTIMGGKAKPGSIGLPLPGVEIRLTTDDGEDVEPGDPGEIVVRGPNVFQGYWQHPEENAKAFRDGWFRTGDVAVADDEGYLFLVDRKRDMIIVSGFNVYPKEIEDVLRGHPKIADCAVVGAPDQYSGEQVRAVIALVDGAGVTEEEVVEFCSAHLAPYKVPASIELVTEIPRNAAGKVLRREFRG